MTDKAPKRGKAKAKEPKPLTPADAALRDALRARNQQRPSRPESELVVEDGTMIIQPAEGQDELLYSAASLEALGTRSIPFLNDTMDNVMRVLSPSRNVTATQYNAAMAIMSAVEPENELEATMAAQMVAANECAMRCMRSMVGSDFADHHKMYGDLANKFLRTFAVTTEALTKLRRGGEQIIKYVHVHEGGQAVIAGTVNHNGGRGNNGSDGQPCRAEAVEGSAALSGPDPSRDGVPIPSDAKRAVPVARGQESGRAEGEPERMEARS